MYEPTPFIRAYYILCSLAGNGRIYKEREVFEPPFNDRGGQVAGCGFKLNRTVTVRDRVKGRTVEGKVALQLLKTIRHSLYIRISLDWQTSAGAKHSVFASYDLTESVVVTLAKKNVSTPKANASGTGVNWHHKYPGDTQANFKYHTEAVAAVCKDNPKLLKALSAVGSGKINTSELLVWLCQQPEIRQLV